LENKLQFERVWVQRSIALVLLFMFWNGFTDVFWSAPSLLFDPLLLVLWLFFVVLYRNELKNLRFVWVLGIAILLNNVLHFSHFSDLINRTVLLQSENSFLVEPISGLLSNLLTSIGWGMFLWKLLLNHPYRNYWMLLFVLFSLPILFFWIPAVLFFNGLLLAIFIWQSKERKPFHWFLIAQFITVCMAVFQMFAWFISFSPGGKG
jgi:hypothetical protein